MISCLSSLLWPTCTPRRACPRAGRSARTPRAAPTTWTTTTAPRRGHGPSCRYPVPPAGQQGCAAGAVPEIWNGKEMSQSLSWQYRSTIKSCQILGWVWLLLIMSRHRVKVIAAREGISRDAEEILKGGRCVLWVKCQSCLEPWMEP